jgi:hypothetical protein
MPGIQPAKNTLLAFFGFCLPGGAIALSKSEKKLRGKIQENTPFQPFIDKYRIMTTNDRKCLIILSECSL